MAGIYSVLSYLVLVRTREFGVRMALGAQRSNILALIFQTAGKLVGVGNFIGIFASIGAARLPRSELNLFQVNPSDPISFLGMILLLRSWPVQPASSRPAEPPKLIRWKRCVTS